MADAPTPAEALATRLQQARVAAAKLGFHDVRPFKTDLDDGALTAIARGESEGAPTAPLLLAALPDGTLKDTAADELLNLAWQDPEESEPVAAIVVADGDLTRFFDLDPMSPHEVDKLPDAANIAQIKRLSREPTFEWSLRVYDQLQGGFDQFHETVYSTVRDTFDGKNDIIDDVAKFIFLELFRLRHPAAEKVFTHKGQQYTLDEVFRPSRFDEKQTKAGGPAVELLKAAFEAFKGHPSYRMQLDDGSTAPIFPDDVHLKLSVPANYHTLIKLLQDLPPLTNNQRQRISGVLGPNHVGKGCLADVAGDVLGRAFDVFLRHKFEKEGIGVYLTPAPVKRAMVEMVLHDIVQHDVARLIELEADGRPAFCAGDPSGGSSGFLVALLPHLKRVVEGLNISDAEKAQLWTGMLEHGFVSADSSPRMVRLSRINLALQGAQKARVFNTANSLTTEQLKPGVFDLILTNPPFGAPKTKTKKEKEAAAALMAHFRTDIDFDAIKGKNKGLYTPSQTGLAMGCSPNAKGEWKPKDKGVDLSVLFLDRCLQLLKPGGRLVMVVPDSLLCNASTRYVREYLIGKKDPKTGQFHGGKAIVKAVVSLPTETFKLSGTGAKTSILYVQKRASDPKDGSRFADEAQTDVFMAVADTLGYKVKNHQEEYFEGGRHIPNDLVPIVGAYVRGE